MAAGNLNLGNLGGGSRSAIGGSDSTIGVSAEELSILGDDPPDANRGTIEDPDAGSDIPPRRGPETDRGRGKDKDDETETDDKVEEDEEDEDTEDPDKSGDEIEDPDETDETRRGADNEDVDADEDDEESGISFKALKKDYPDIFTKYPDLRSALAHGHAVGELFPTRKDAETAARKVEAYDAINSKLGQGEAKDFVEVISKNKDNFSKFSENFLGEVRKADPELFKSLVIPSIKQVVLNSLLEARANNNVPLFKSAKNIAIHLFGRDWQRELTAKAEKKEPETAKEDPEKIALQEKLQKFEMEKRNGFVMNVTKSTDKEVGKIANSIFRKADPEGKKLSERVRKALTTEARESVAEKLRGNPEYMRQFRSLMDKAKKASFDSGLEPRVINAYLGRAKNLFPTVLQQLIAEELGIKQPQKDKQRRVPQSGNAPNQRKEDSPHPDKVFKGPNAKTELEFLSE